MDVDVRYLLLTLVLCSGTIGCRGTDASIELLESELRWMEDQLYLMDQELSVAHAKLHSSQRYNQSLKHEIESLRQGSRGGTSSEAGTQPPRFDEPPNEMDLTVPEIDLGTDVDTLNGEGEDSTNGAPRIDNSGEPPDSNLDELDELDNTTRSRKGIVDRIVLNSRLTGGYDFDGRPGDEGLLLVIEPQDKSGRYVALPGELTIAVYDPTKHGEEARVAQWEYSAEESTELLRETLLGKGFHLQLPWPNDLPDQSQLTVSTTYCTEQGERLRIRRTIQIDTGNDSVADARQPFTHEATFGPHPTGITGVSAVPAPPKAPTLLPVSPEQTVLGQPTWEPSRRASVARQPQHATPNVSGKAPTWRPYR